MLSCQTWQCAVTIADWHCISGDSQQTFEEEMQIILVVREQILWNLGQKSVFKDIKNVYEQGDSHRGIEK